MDKPNLLTLWSDLDEEKRERKYGKKAPKWTLGFLLSVRLEAESALKRKGA